MRWIYVNNDDNSSRYILGTEGKKSLICFGINPSTAEPENLDNTLKSVERLTKNNGFDSWIMLNVYPQRATNPKNLHKDMNEELHKQNLKEIENVLKNSPVIWAAWGTLIRKRKYLPKCLKEIVEIAKKYNCKWVSIGKSSKYGHPHHPLFLSSSEKCEEFLVDDYLETLK